ncbi:MAG: IS607 family transposase [Candidatus Methanomethylicota archaeon]|uniref:IS607 family transposase n=1 Tax=Thermoproteota archaeon TaxID=2056631 RepID=A0A497ELQ0_9CREN|nr:MAG: IS607 family transposase [Candidatus Verstraetearchaeota archaeon]
MERHYTTREVCEILGITNRTLRRWIKEGKIRAVNIGGRWRIPESEIKRILGQPVEEIRTPRAARVVIYARVSGANQKKELENQVEALKKYIEQNNWELVAVVKDIASGLKEDRRGLWKLIEMAKKHEFDVLLVAYRDRLTRFGFKYLEELFKAYGIKVVVAFQEPPKDFYQELVEDLIKIFTSFVSRIYGKRSHKYKKVVEAVEQTIKDP